MIIVTGATGFIGSNVVADLNAAGCTDVVLVDDLGSQLKWKNIAKSRFSDIVHPREAAAWMQSIAGAEAVVHMGADSSTTSTDGDEVLRTNLRASMHWWQWCTRTRTPLIYASSAATYGDGAHGFEDADSPAALDQLAPLNLYGWSKHAFDKWATERAAKGECPPQWAGMKFFNVYGPNEYHKGSMQSLVAKNTAQIASGSTVALFKSYNPKYADGEQLRDFVYVKDCCRVVTWLLGRPGAQGLFNLGTGQARSFLDLMRGIGAALRREIAVDFVDMPQSIRPNYQYFTEARMDKLRRAGYERPFFSLEDGVADYVRGHLATADPYR
jgi:ADP-L-glycero-D-manno-heptose 6-epimerase